MVEKSGLNQCLWLQYMFEFQFAWVQPTLCEIVKHIFLAGKSIDQMGGKFTWNFQEICI
jgi:hypothetical protein